MVELLLSLSIIADILMVGLPNSGKTTLLKTLTGARVEAADYPFSTRQPCLGTYEIPGGRDLSLCELPAIYAHSAEGRGLGNAFLKHLKRAKLIFLMVDVSNTFARDLKDAYRILIDQIRAFNPEFLKIKRFVVVNKIDFLGKGKGEGKGLRLKDPVFYISTKTGVGIKKLMSAAVKAIRKSEDKE